MKIGFCGNVNNYPFMLARAMKRLGHEVVFIVNRKLPLDRPEFRYADISFPYPDWIHDVSQFNFWDAIFPTGKHLKTLRLLRSCDIVIATEAMMAFLPSFKVPTMAFTTGSDLESFASWSLPDIAALQVKRKPRFVFRALCRFILRRFVARQREGIRSANLVNYPVRGLLPIGDEILNDLGVPDSKRIFVLMTDLENIRAAPAPSNPTVQALCVARFNWKMPYEPRMCARDYKGSDIMIRGFGLFYRETGLRVDIRFVKKGVHLRETIQLIEEEGIADQVTWLEEMSQAQLLEECRKADFVLDQFSQSIVGMAGLDAMALGRPLIANWRPEFMDQVTGEASPVCQASTPEEVCAQLRQLVSDRAERERIGKASRAFVERHFSTDAAARFCLSRLSK